MAAGFAGPHDGRTIRVEKGRPILPLLYQSDNPRKTLNTLVPLVRRPGSANICLVRSSILKLCILFIVMRTFDFLKTIKSSEHRLAFLVAIATDAVQIVALPFFAEGALSPADTFLDVIVAGILTRLLGWHWAFLPGLVAELIPGLDMFPTWTAAVFYVTRDRVRSAEMEQSTASLS